MQMRQAAPQTGRERTLEARPGPLDFLDTLCNMLGVILKVFEITGRRAGYAAIVVGSVVFPVGATAEWWIMRRERPGIINGMTKLCNAKTCERRCW
jgi:hypothetical protein